MSFINSLNVRYGFMLQKQHLSLAFYSLSQAVKFRATTTFRIILEWDWCNYYGGNCLSERGTMTVETDKLCDDLRSWTRSPSIGLVEYSDDPTIQRRVGIMLSKYASKFSSGSKETDSTS